MLAAPVLASLLSLALAGASGLDPRMHALLAPEASAGELADAERALRLFEARRFADAADVFEALWRSTGTSRYVFNAAVARERMGHEAVAYAHLRRFLAAPGLSADERSAGELRLKDLLLRTTPLRVVLTPPPGGDAAGVVVILELIDKGDRPPIELDPALFGAKARPGVVEARVEAGTWRVRAKVPGARPVQDQVTVVFPEPAEVTLKLEPEVVPVEISVGPAEAVEAGVSMKLTPEGGGEPIAVTGASAVNQVEVAPGRYTLELSAPGFISASESVVIGPDARTATMTLRPLAKPEIPAKEGLNKTGIGLGVAGGVVGITGISLLGVAASRFEDRFTEYDSASSGDVEPKSNNLRFNIEAQERGGGFLGFGLGASVSALITLVPQRSSRGAWVEAGVGAAMVVGGGVAYGLLVSRQDESLREYDDLLFQGTTASAPELAIRRAAAITSAASIGAGCGLLLGGAVKLLVRQRRASERRGDLSLTPTLSGVQMMLTRRF